MSMPILILTFVPPHAVIKGWGSFVSDSSWLRPGDILSGHRHYVLLKEIKDTKGPHGQPYFMVKEYKNKYIAKIISFWVKWYNNVMV